MKNYTVICLSTGDVVACDHEDARETSRHYDDYVVLTPEGDQLQDTVLVPVERT